MTEKATSRRSTDVCSPVCRYDTISTLYQINPPPPFHSVFSEPRFRNIHLTSRRGPHLFECVPVVILVTQLVVLPGVVDEGRRGTEADMRWQSLTAGSTYAAQPSEVTL